MRLSKEVGNKLSPTKRRWLRFSLRSFFIAFTSIALLLSFWVFQIEKERRAVKQIEQSGGSVYYEQEVDYARQEFESRHTKFMCSLLVMGGFTNASIVKFAGLQTSRGLGSETKKPLEKETLKAISSLSTITGLKFYDHPLKLVNLHYLRNLTELRTLQFCCFTDTQSSDCIALDQLGGMANLQGLAMNDLPDVRGQLGFLSNLSNLRTLDILSENLGLEDLEVIGALTKLEQLVLSGLSNCESGLYQLANLSELEHLDLGEEPIKGSNLEKLKSLNKLRYLRLCPSEIDDILITFLESLTNLRYLDLSCMQVDKQGLQKLHAALPRCHVTPKASSDDFWIEENSTDFWEEDEYLLNREPVAVPPE